jgi:phosphate transport system permease protein
MNSLMNFRRRATNLIMLTGTVLCALLAMVPLIAVLYYVIIQGLPALNWDFITKMPAPVGETGGGMANAIIGSILLVAGGCCVGLPIGILGGLYLAEYGQNKYGWWVRFFADVLNGVPSIVMGVFVYTIIVLPMRRFSAYAGAVALGVMMVPLVMRTTEEMVRMVPNSQREGSLSLGATHASTVFKVVLPISMAGVTTGVLLAIARVAGETAPLLFTAFGNNFWSLKLDQPIASLPVQIYNYAISPYDDWHAQAWAGALVLVAMSLIINILARIVTRKQVRRIG